MVFQDGHKYVNVEQEQRVPIVFDNLIHKREMPVTIAIFVNPGQRGEASSARSSATSAASRTSAADTSTHRSSGRLRSD
jgi:enterochelin esterase-like enzyme